MPSAHHSAQLGSTRARYGAAAAAAAATDAAGGISRAVDARSAIGDGSGLAALGAFLLSEATNAERRAGRAFLLSEATYAERRARC